MLEKKEEEHEISCFVHHYIDSYIKLDVLHFLGRHPDTQFNMAAMLCGLTQGRSVDLHQAVFSLEREGLVERQSHNGTVLYSLTRQQEKRNLALKLSACTRYELQRWHQLQQLLCQQTPLSLDPKSVN